MDPRTSRIDQQNIIRTRDAIPIVMDLLKSNGGIMARHIIREHLIDLYPELNQPYYRPNKTTSSGTVARQIVKQVVQVMEIHGLARRDKEYLVLL